MDLARFIHVLGVAIWVGGMFFAYLVLRPAAATLEPPQRLPLWQQTFRRFFFWVWLCIAAILISGFWMLVLIGGFGTVGIHVHLMLLLGLAMMGIFGHVYFAPYRRLIRFVSEKDWKSAAAALAQIRRLVAVNLGIGLVNVAVGTVGRWLAQ